MQSARRELTKLRHFHRSEAAALGPDRSLSLDGEICGIFDELEQTVCGIGAAWNLTPRASDAVSSAGERLSSLIVTAGLRAAGIDAVHLDARDAIITDGHYTRATPLFPETNGLVRRKVCRERVTVMGGFIGATDRGVTTTLGRGGSDYTAAIVGAALGADEIQIWTDVDGMLTCDPRLVPGAHCLRSISYAEAEQMAKAGANVLHPATVIPAIQQGIPLTIRNSRNPAATGTRIVAESSCDGVVMSIACRRGIELLQLSPRGDRVTADFGSELWEEFQEEGFHPELFATSGRKLSVVIEAGALTPEFRSRIGAIAEIETLENRALITLVGQGASRNPENLARAGQRLRGIREARYPGGVLNRVSHLWWSRSR